MAKRLAMHLYSLVQHRGALESAQLGQDALCILQCDLAAPQHTSSVEKLI